MRRIGILTGLLSVVLIAFGQNKPANFEAYQQTVPGSQIKFKMVPIPGGDFTMGTPASEKGRSAEEGPQRKVGISPFWMGATEVTHDEFLIFFNDESFVRNSKVDAVTRPTTQYIDLSWGMGKAGGFPFNSMSQLTAMMYCKWLYKKTGIFYRLPTEAEWEYACRAGTKTPYYFGSDPKMLDAHAWHAGNSDGKYHKVAQKKPNAWGLYDMLGNVAEWTLDQYDAKYLANLKDGVKDPMTEPKSKYPKTLKGGGYTESASQLRSGARFASDPSWNKRDPQIPKSKWWLTDAAAVGFRIVRPLQQPSPEEAEKFYQKYMK